MLKKAKAKVTRQDIEPDDDESYEDFMDRCSDEIGDDDVCQIIWDNRAADSIRYKTHAEKVSGLEFVLSDETPDRMDDIIMSDGWDLANFNKNPIALFGHQSGFPIGKWKNVRVVDKQLRGFLELAECQSIDVWSWRPDAGAKLEKGASASCGRWWQKSRSPGRARSKP
jgi:hypothetical protein